MNKLILCDIEVSKKEFYDSKKAINLGLIDVNRIVVSNKIKGNNETSKFFIGCLDVTGSIVTPLCIILPQMSGYIKYFENGEKNMSFKIDDESVYVSSIKWIRLAHFLTPNFTPKIITPKILTPNTHA